MNAMLHVIVHYYLVDITPHVHLYPLLHTLPLLQLQLQVHLSLSLFFCVSMLLIHNAHAHTPHFNQVYSLFLFFFLF